MKTCKMITCFIASPGDVAEERQIIDEEIERINNAIGIKKGFIIKSVMWERDAVPDAGLDSQDVINRQLSPGSHDIVIGVFWSRMGTETPRAKSGSEEEILSALREGAINGVNHIQLYFSSQKVEIKTLDCRQLQRLKKFRSQMENKYGCLVGEFEDKVTFARIIHDNLEKTVLDMIEGTDTAGARNLDTLGRELEETFRDSITLFYGQKTDWIDRRLCEHDFYVDECLAHSIKKSFPASDILQKKESCVIRAPSLFGLTTLGHYLCYKAYALYNKLWVYLDVANVGIREEKLQSWVSKWERKASRSASCIVVDSWSFGHGNGRKTLENLEKLFPKKRLILLTTIDSPANPLSLEVLQPKRKYKVFDLLALTKNDVRHVVELAGGAIKHETDVILEKIIRDMEMLNVHRTPMNCLTLLKVAEESFDRNPINRTHMLETLLVVLFNINELPTHGSVPDAKDCEQILGAFCEYLLKNTVFSFKKDLYFNTCAAFCKTKLIEIDYNILWEILVRNKIIIAGDNGDYRFKARFWVCFFAAKRMIYDKDFYDYIFSEKRYTSFPEVVEFYTGINRNETGILTLLAKDLHDTMLRLQKYIGIKGVFNPYEGITWRVRKEEVEQLAKELSARIASSSLPKEIKDQHADESYNHIRPYNQRIEDFLHQSSFLVYINQVKSLSRALRNSDYADPEIRKQLISDIFRGWVEISKVIYALAPILARKGVAAFLDFKIHLSSDFDELKDDFKKLIFTIILVLPANVLRMLKDDLASDRIGLLVGELLKSSNDMLTRHFIVLFLISERPSGWAAMIRTYLSSIEGNSYFMGMTFDALKYQYKYMYMSPSDQREVLRLMEMSLSIREIGSVPKENNPRWRRYVDQQIPTRCVEE